MYLDYEIAPKEIKDIAGNCGPVSLWMVLEKHGIKAAPKDIIDASRYCEEFGSFAICLAVALSEFGLSVCFHTDEDHEVQSIERACYSLANSRISISKAKIIGGLLADIEQGKSVILSYMAGDGEGHFSPLIGEKSNKLIMAYANEEFMLKSVFNHRWRSPGILRQSIVVV